MNRVLDAGNKLQELFDALTGLLNDLLGTCESDSQKYDDVYSTEDTKMKLNVLREKREQLKTALAASALKLEQWNPSETQR